MTNAVAVGLSQDNNGGAVAPFVAGKNILINGGMDIWQRGTSFAIGSSNAYTADRFTSTLTGTGINLTVTQDTSVPNVNSIYSMKYTQTGAATSVAEYATRYWPETQDAMRLAGKTVTLSFWYKSNKTGTHGARISTGSQTGGAESSVGFNVVAANTWQYITWTTAVPFGSITAITTAPNAGIGILDIGFRVGGAGVGFTSIASGDYFQISQLQLEIGSVATPFSRAGGTLQGELAACQRYYFRATGSLYNSFAAGSSGNTTTTIVGYTNLPVTMRTKPTSVDYATLAGYDNATIFGGTITAGIDPNLSTPNIVICDYTGFTGLTNYRPYWIVSNNSTSGYLGFSAEL
jgi:hypothetical protein